MLVQKDEEDGLLPGKDVSYMEMLLHFTHLHKTAAMARPNIIMIRRVAVVMAKVHVTVMESLPWCHSDSVELV